MLINNKYISIRASASQLKQTNKELSFLLEMSNFLSIALDLHSLLKGALSKVLDHFDLEAGRIYLLNDEGSSFHLAVHQGMRPMGLETLGFDEGFSGKAAKTKSFIAQHVSELEDQQRAQLLSKKGIKIIICVPLIAMHSVVGVMNLSSKRLISLNQDKIDLCIAVGNQIAIAASNAKIYQELQNKIEVLNEKKNTIKFFAYSISHDLKSPAIGIHGLVKRLRDKKGMYLDESGKEYCDQILMASEQMLALVEELNAYISSKESPLTIERIKVKEITEAIRTEFSERLKEKNIKWTEADTLPEISADRGSLLRVFRNFADNSVKYGGPDMTKISIGYKSADNHHIFSFIDDGVGLKGQDREKVFDPFHRDETSRGTAGSGLGLAIVREVAKRHQGNVWISSGTGKGADFRISIAKSLDIHE
jgi:K+-sensing histidine kinase KdpD